MNFTQGKTRDVGCQWEPQKRGRATVATQLSEYTLKSIRSKAIQVNPSTSSFGSNTEVKAEFGGFTSTPDKTRPPPLKRRRLETLLDDTEDLDDAEEEPVDSSQSTYHPSMSSLSDSTIVRQWKSQPIIGSTPAGNLQLSAAVHFTGTSFRQISKSNECGGSAKMEKEGLIRSLDFLEKSAVKVASIVTDRHSQIQKFLRIERNDIEHFYDVWHVAKAYVDNLMRVFFDEVLHEPAKFTVELQELKIPDTLCSQFHRPEKQ
ncbi:unnamed protein product [Leuciscus chuanchicus]